MKNVTGHDNTHQLFAYTGEKQRALIGGSIVIPEINVRFGHYPDERSPHVL